MTDARLKLRQVDTRVPRLVQHVAGWSAGHAATVQTICLRRGMVRIEAMAAGQRYVGWANAVELARNAYPAWRDVAWQAVDARHLCALMNEDDAIRRVLVAPAAGWCDVKCMCVLDADSPPEPVLRVEAKGRIAVSFVELPARLPVCDSAARAARVPITLRYALGRTEAPLVTLRRLRVGDAILIQTWAPEVKASSQRMFTFSLEGNTMILNDKSDGAQASATPAGGEARHARASDGRPFEVDALPVKLEFVLEQNETTVAEVAALHAGMVVPLAPGAEREVTIYANGRYLARGELIQVGERLAVELQSIELAEPK
ncbi:MULTISPECIES: type III secretion system cytoplasmic ring protein SctQ [unclassified Burkholderia]|uniref:type III secretion system cytoplasmic ring protein SctQ n=1 Tax=unclassified Burkholderia TaxID=2613784 RepID=UPI0009EBA12C|nr:MULTISPECIES: type III secretion system cytoplasmic ring protein SctQ [unclassified Burkholderia]